MFLFDVPPDQQLIVAYVPGVESIESLYQTVQEAGKDPSIAEYNTIILVNDTSNLPPDVASLFANLVNSIESIWGVDGDYKTALVVNTPLDYGISRVFTTFRGRRPEHMMVFRDLGESLKWLGVTPENFSEVISTLSKLGAGDELLQLDEVE